WREYLESGIKRISSAGLRRDSAEYLSREDVLSLRGFETCGTRLGTNDRSRKILAPKNIGMNVNLLRAVFADGGNGCPEEVASGYRSEVVIGRGMFHGETTHGAVTQIEFKSFSS